MCKLSKLWSDSHVVQRKLLTHQQASAVNNSLVRLQTELPYDFKEKAGVGRNIVLGKQPNLDNFIAFPFRIPKGDRTNSHL